MAQSRRKSPATHHADVKKLKLLITVIPRAKTEFFIDLLHGYEINFQTCVSAQGTAGSETLRLLGLANADKSVIFSVIREDKSEEILQVIRRKFESVRGGKGFAVTTPHSSVVGVAIYRFLSNHKSGL